MEQNFLDKIEELYNEGRHEEIIEAIEALPDEEKEYNILMMLARSYYDIMDDDDTAHFEKTLKILKSISKEGEGDLVWMYLIGKTYFNLNQEEVAIEYFEKIDKIFSKDNDLDVLSSSLFIDTCREYMHKKAVKTIENLFSHCFGIENVEFKNDFEDDNYVIVKSYNIKIDFIIKSLHKNCCEIDFKTSHNGENINIENKEYFGSTLENAVTQAASEYIQKLQEKLSK